MLVERIKSFGTKIIGFVDSSQVNTLFGSRSHVVRFVNDGVLNFAYNAQNENIELSARKVQCALSPLGGAVFDVLGDCEPQSKTPDPDKEN